MQMQSVEKWQNEASEELHKCKETTANYPRSDIR